mgnify:CR=1 FL=1
MTATFNAIIVDDEPLARKGLTIRLKQHPEISIIAECKNGREAIEAIKTKSPDIVFLDIQMPGTDGFQVVDEVTQSCASLPQFVFVTAYDQFAIKAFEVHAIDYLLKPVEEGRLAQCLEKVMNNFASKENAKHKETLVQLYSDVTGNASQTILEGLENETIDSLTSYSDVLAIKDGSEVTRVPVKGILWVDAAGDYMCVHTEEETHILRKTMKELEQALDPKLFLRIHRSIIVNVSYVNKFSSQINGEYFITLQNGKELKVSRSYKDKVKQMIVS